MGPRPDGGGGLQSSKNQFKLTSPLIPVHIENIIRQRMKQNNMPFHKMCSCCLVGHSRHPGGPF